jgi:PKD repeat protein
MSAAPAAGRAPGGEGRFASRTRLIMAIVFRDIRQMRRHGLPLMLGLSAVLLVVGFIFFSMVSSQFRHTGVPGWTGNVVSEGGGEGLAAEISADRMSGPAPLAVSLTSNVTGGTPPYSYSWNSGAGQSSDAPNPSFSYATPASYDCYLTVRDFDGGNITASPLRILVFGDPQGELRAAISVNRSEGKEPFTVSFRAAVIGGVPPYTYSWELGDGGNSSMAAPAHEYGSAGSFKASLVVKDSAGNFSISNNLTISVEGKGGAELPVNLLDIVYGYCVLVTMFLVPAAFSTAYSHEMQKGTVRTLVCYPVGVLDITAAKLAYAAVVGLAFSAIVAILPALASMKPAGEVIGIFLAAYLLTLATVAVGAFAANALTKVTRRMYIRPTGLSTILLVLSFLFTTKIFGALMSGLKLFLGMADLDPAGAVRSWMPAITLSPYHLGGASLSAALGGCGSPPYFVAAVPILLLAFGIWASRRVYPDIYEKE